MMNLIPLNMMAPLAIPAVQSNHTLFPSVGESFAFTDPVLAQPIRPESQNPICVIGMRMQCPDGRIHAGKIQLMLDAEEREYADDLELQLRARLIRYSGEELERYVAFGAVFYLVESILSGNTNKAAVCGNLIYKLMGCPPGILLFCDLNHHSKVLLNAGYDLVRSKGETVEEANIVIDQMIGEVLG